MLLHSAAVINLLPAAIPYFKLTGLELGPLTIQPWGVLVASGFLIGTSFAQRLAVRRGVEPKHIGDVVVWLAVGALVFGHLGHALFYDPSYYFAHPVEFLYFWSGLSSFGGFIGCAGLTIYFLKKRQLNVLKFGDLVLAGLSLGWAIGRIGCFVVHDHIGRPLGTSPQWLQSTLGWLALEFPAGTTGHGAAASVRWELGLMDSLLAWLIFGVVVYLSRKPRRPGTYLGAVPLLYGAGRFFLDFLRNVDLSHPDARYMGLTPAQYGSVALVAIGAAVLVSSRRRPLWPADGLLDPPAKGQGA